MGPIAVSLDPLPGRIHCGFDGACLTKDRLAMLVSIGILNGRFVFFPCPLERPFLARQESLSLAVLHSVLAFQVRADRPRSYRLPSRSYE